jgi:hypothetical protein
MPRPKWFEITIRDDLGQDIPMANIFIPRWRHHDDGRLKVLQRAAAKWWATDPTIYVYPPLIGVLIPTVNVLASNVAPGLDPNARFAMAICVVVILGAAVRAVGNRFRVHDRVANEVKVLMLREGYCPACQFNLHGLAATDGYIRCGECGGAWAARRLETTAPTSPLNEPPICADRPPSPTRVLSVTIVDHRNERGRARPWPRVRGSRLDYAHIFQRAVSTYNRPRSRQWTIGVLSLGAAGFVVFTIGVYMNGRSQYWDDAKPFVILTMTAFFIASVAMWYLRMPLREHRKRLVAAFTSWSLCPRCGTDLLTRPPDPDGCVGCPHCNAAWHLGKPSSRCDRCHHDLAGLPVTVSGHATCPECGDERMVDRDRRGLPPRP